MVFFFFFFQNLNISSWHFLCSLLFSANTEPRGPAGSRCSELQTVLQAWLFSSELPLRSRWPGLAQPLGKCPSLPSGADLCFLIIYVMGIGCWACRGLPLGATSHLKDGNHGFLWLLPHPQPRPQLQLQASDAVCQALSPSWTLLLTLLYYNSFANLSS